MQHIAILMQGLAERVEAFAADHQWLQAEDLFVLSYDRPVDKELNVFSIYDPACSWASGRNRLFEMAKTTQRFRGFIFMDDDVIFEEGDMRQFVDLCRANPDLVITPVVDKAVRRECVLDCDFQRPLVIDDQMYYMPAALIQSSGVYPLITDYDHVSWWIPCEISQEILLQRYWKQCLQANRIRIANALHRAGTEGSNYRMASFATVLEIANSHVRRTGTVSLFYRNFERRPAGRWARRYWRFFCALRRRRAPIPARKIRQPS